MSPDVVLSCSKLQKSYSQMLIPSSMLQEKIIRWRKKGVLWRRKVLDEVTLVARRGEWVGIYGHNGAGKTTLLRLLAGIQTPDSGEIFVQGKLGCFFDLTAGFHPERTAAENIYISGLLHGLHAREIRTRVDEIIAFAGTETHRDLPLKCYSTGMMLRLAFSSLLQVQADIYLFDEVFAVGDAEFQRKCVQAMHDLRAAGKTVLLVSHSTDVLNVLCDRVLHFENGRIIRDEPATGVMQHALNSVSALFPAPNGIEPAPPLADAEKIPERTPVAVPA